MKKLIAEIVAIVMMVCGCAAAFAAQDNLSRVDAMRAALDFAGLKEEQVNFTKVQPDWDDGRQVWDIEFIFNGIEYEIEVDARNGRIIESDRDYVYGRDMDDDWDDDWDDWFDFD